MIVLRQMTVSQKNAELRKDRRTEEEKVHVFRGGRSQMVIGVDIVA